MLSSSPSAPTTGKLWPCRLLAAILILGSAALHIAYLFNNCPLDLAPDEAHYWDWSRHLDWSYYSKGPLVAWLIRASCTLVGPLAQEITGTQMPAVRLPAVFCGTALLCSLYVLTTLVFRRESLALAVVIIALCSPVFAAGSLLMTIDAPYTCCWGWALVLGYRAVFRSSKWAWPVLGLAIGIGILAKYTMVLFLPSLGLFLFFSREHRNLICRPGFWIMTGIAALCCTPILVWNLQNDWVTLKHVGGQAGLREAERFRWWGPAEYVGIQAALLLGFWFIAWSAAMIAACPWKQTDPGTRYLWWLSAPMFTVFLLFSLKTHEEPNWAITAYLSGLVLAVDYLARQMQSNKTWYRRLTWTCTIGTCCLGLMLTVLMHRSDLAQPLLMATSGQSNDAHPIPLRRFDPTCRLRGWQYLGWNVDRIRGDVTKEGIEPIIVSGSWNVPGEMGFYCRGNPAVYSFGLALGDRHSQYDLWRPNPVFDREKFTGKTFILIGDPHPILPHFFDKIEPSEQVIYAEKGQPVAAWKVTVCRGFRGFGEAVLSQRRF